MFFTGALKLFDTDTCSQVYSLSDLGCVNSVSIATGGGTTAVGVASYCTYFPPSSFQEVTQSRVMVLLAVEKAEWERRYLSLPSEEKVNLYG